MTVVGHRTFLIQECLDISAFDTTVTNETVKRAFHVCHTPVAREYVGHTRKGKLPMHNLQCQRNCLVTIDVQMDCNFYAETLHSRALSVTFEPYFSRTRTEF